MKTKYHFLVTYSSAEEILSVLHKKEEQIDAYAFICHDKDKYDRDIINKSTGELIHNKGDLESPHYHIFLVTCIERNSMDISRWFVQKSNGVVTNNCLVESVRYSVKGAIEYLTHSNKSSADNEFKFKYDNSSVTCFGIDLDNLDKFTINVANNDNTMEMVTDYLSGVPIRTMIQTYGRDFVYHFKQIREICECIDSEEHTCYRFDNMNNLTETHEDAVFVD